MNSGFRSQCIPTYRVLTEEQCHEIHLATLEVLSTIGVRVMNDEGLQLLRDAGCQIKGADVVTIPNWLVEECIQSAPSRISIFNRNGVEAMRLEGRKIYFGMGTDLIITFDMKTQTYRPTMLQDVANAVRVADACSEIDFVSSLGLPHDVPTNAMYVESVKAEIENTTKPLMFTAGGSEDLTYIYRMAAEVAGGEEALRAKPFLIHYSEPTPPLTHSYGAVRKLFLCAERGLPILYPPGLTMGGTGPVTLAGGIVQANAEALSGIVLHQLKAKGAPIISGFAAVPLDMASSTFCYGAPEFRLTNSAMTDLYHYYGIPMWSTTGTDSHAFDEQAAIEHSIAIFMAALDGANLIHDIGYLGQGLISHPAMLLMCNELISYVKRILRGFDLTPEKIGFETIREVGPGGNFMAEMHTVKHFRQEQWRPQFMNRDDPDTWQKKGAKSYAEVVTQKALALLETHEPAPLPAGLQASLNRIAQEARQELAGVHFRA
jgi:trimethylamine--corrinoid protein Co-methyltransferase